MLGTYLFLWRAIQLAILGKGCLHKGLQLLCREGTSPHPSSMWHVGSQGMYTLAKMVEVLMLAVSVGN